VVLDYCSTLVGVFGIIFKNAENFPKKKKKHLKKPNFCERK
jgi:hypothetical protein